ncbi:MAG: M14 family zinc carboxypeptidase [Planctomycetota bacterium]
MKAAVSHGSAGGDFTVDLSPDQVASLRAHGFVPVPMPADHPERGTVNLTAGGLANWTSYLTMRADFVAKAAAFPAIAEFHVIGQSVQGRDIFGLRISGNVAVEEDEPEVMFWANIHGDEFASGEIAYQWALELIDAYGIETAATSYVDNNEIWVVPLLNPDGHELGTRENVNGVDLNRDFGWNWDGWGGSPAPYSQPETRALREFCLVNNVTLSVTMHCSGNVFLYPWCDEPQDAPEIALIQQVGALYANAANYQLIKSWDDYETHGELLDLIHGGLGSLCYTAEISNLLASYDDSYARNKAGMDLYCAEADRGLHGLVTDAQSGQPVHAAVFISGSPFPAYTDPGVGDVHRMTVPGTYDVTVWANGYLPQTITGLLVAHGQTANFQMALQPVPGADEHAFAVTTVNQRDPNNSYTNVTPQTHALGAPDGQACSIGPFGYIVLDVGAGHLITDGPGDDFIVTEAVVPGDSVAERYSVWVGNAYDQTAFLGWGIGTAAFDLADASVGSTRYVRILSSSDADIGQPLAGMELDGITVLNHAEGKFVVTGPGTGGAFGTPVLDGSGDLTPNGAGFTLNVSHVAPSAPGFLFVSLADRSPPVLVAGVSFHVGLPWLAQIPLSVNPAGSLSMSLTAPALLAGLDITLQSLWSDSSGPSGVATATNGLRLEFP